MNEYIDIVVKQLEILDYLINEHSRTIGDYDGFTEQDRKWNERERKIYNKENE